MNNSKDLIGIDKIEHMFANNISFHTNQKDLYKKNLNSRINIKKIYAVYSFLLKKIYRFMPDIIKDIVFLGWASHKAPSTKLFAKTKYDELRTIFDIKVSSLVISASPTRIQKELFEIFKKGFYETNIQNMALIDGYIEDVLNYSKPHHAGARPYFKDGKNQQIEDSFSAYFLFSEEDNEEILELITNSLKADFKYYLSVLAGYHCEFKDISFQLGIVFGENSNSEMHQDTFSSIAKGFIYLQDIDATNAPFEYLEGSYMDAAFRSKQTNKAVLSEDFHSSGSTRVRNGVLRDAIEKYKLKTFTGPKGTFVLANTSGYHRKGAHKSTKPRITLNFEIQRKGVFSKLIRNLLSVAKYKISSILNLHK
jgi:hypothetical protein